MVSNWKKQYEYYLQSEEWAEVRACVLERDGHKCTKCKSKKNLQVHHTSYRNLGIMHLEIDDCVTVCRLCHMKEHGIKSALDLL